MPRQGDQPLKAGRALKSWQDNFKRDDLNIGDKQFHGMPMANNDSTIPGSGPGDPLGRLTDGPGPYDTDLDTTENQRCLRFRP